MHPTTAHQPPPERWRPMPGCPGYQTSDHGHIRPTPAATHPAWCDPQLCTALGADVHHRDRTLQWDTLDHVRLTVGLARLDNTRVGDHDHTHVALALDDTDNRVVVDLHPSEARALAAQLCADADRADTTNTRS